MKKVLIYGYGKSGKSVERVLELEKIQYKIYDDRIKIRGGVYLPRLDKTSVQQFDTIIISPSISIYHKMIRYAISIGIEVISELEFGSRYTNNIIAVTGTNGKTTTAKLLYDILSSAGHKVALVGNIGTPITECYGQKYDYVVTEVSSFQLEATNSFCPIISVILNIDEDHIDRHKNFKNYVQAKLNIYKHQTNDGVVIINKNNKYIDKSVNVNIKTFSDNDSRADMKMMGDKIFYKDKPYVDLHDIDLPTYLENILACALVSYIVSVEHQVVESSIKNFAHQPHRLQEVAVIDDVTYINDSKATNIHATKKAIESMNDKSINLILGGMNKDLNFYKFFKNIDNCVKRVFCFGKSGKWIYIYAKLCGIKYVKYKKNLKDIVDMARQVSGPQEVILFSPACSSLDAYDSYVHRGEEFISIVSKYESI